MDGEIRTWDELLARRPKKTLVGREREDDLFRLNAVYQVPRYLIFFLQGAPGSGKSALLDHFRAIASESGALAVTADALRITGSSAQTILLTMAQIAEQLEQLGAPLTVFNERYRQYCAFIDAASDDPDAPGAVFGLWDGLYDADPWHTQAWDSYLARKLPHAAMIQLVKTPVETLTAAFVNDLNAWAVMRRFVLCFEDWQETEPYLDVWLRDLLLHHKLSTRIWVVLASRTPLSQPWYELQSITASLQLEALTPEDIRQMAAASGIGDEARVADIVAFSNGLPLWSSLLMSARGGDAGDLALSPFDRYLKWLDDALFRRAVLLCSAAHLIDQESIAAIMGHSEGKRVYAWLAKSPLAMQRGGELHYHPALRTQIHAYAQYSWPEALKAAHGDLYRCYQSRLQAYDAPGYCDNQWRTLLRESLYQGLMAGEEEAMVEGLQTFLTVLHQHAPLAGDVVQAWQQAAEEQEAPNAVTAWAERLRVGWPLLQAKEWEAIIEWCERISEEPLAQDGRIRNALGEVCASSRARIPAPVLADPEPEAEAEELAQEPAAEAVEQPTLAEATPQAISPETTLASADPTPETETALADVSEEPGQTAEASEAAQETVMEPGITAPVDPITEPSDETVETHLLRGDAALRAGAYEEAIERYTQALALDPHSNRAYQQRALAYLYLGNTAKTIEDCTQALTYEPSLASAYRHRGMAHARQNALMPALADFEQALELDPNDALSYHSRGNVHHRLKDYERAIADYDRAIQLRPDYVEAYVNRGLVQFALEEYRQAISDYSQALAFAPENALVYLHRGQAYMRLRRYALALADAEQALRCDPHSALAHNNRGLALVQLGDYAEALSAYRQAVQVDPGFAVAHYNAACAAALQEDAPTACGYLKQAIALQPRYRAMAARDGDFDAIREDRVFRRLIEGAEA